MVKARMKVEGGQNTVRIVESVRNVLKLSDMNKSVKERAYQASLRGKYEVFRGSYVESVEMKQEQFRDIVNLCPNDVCVKMKLKCVEETCGWTMKK